MAGAALSSTGRVRRWRQRQHQGQGAPLKLAPGRQRLRKLSGRGARARRQRDAAQARTNLRALVREFLRLRVIAKASLTAARDVRRQLRFAGALQRKRATAAAVALLLWYDRAFRAPALSKQLLQRWDIERARGLDSMTAAEVAVTTVRRTFLRATGCVERRGDGPGMAAPGRSGSFGSAENAQNIGCSTWRGGADEPAFRRRIPRLRPPARDAGGWFADMAF